MKTRSHHEFADMERTEIEELRDENERLRIRLGEIENIAVDAVKCAIEQQQVIAVARRELERARAVNEWFEEVQQVAFEQNTESRQLGVLAVAHALTEVWLSGEPVTARAVADVLGWYADYGKELALEWLAPLMRSTPLLLLEDLRPNIKVNK